MEFHVPGNPVLARMMLDESLRRGARQAEAGEFTAGRISMGGWI